MNCPTCEDTGCPYCGGPEADYHTWCFDCPDCNGDPLNKPAEIS